METIKGKNKEIIMPYESFEACDALLKQGACCVCRGSLRAERDNKHFCVNSGDYAWGCMECRYLFHHHESYPSSGVISCPACGHDVVGAEHLG